MKSGDRVTKVGPISIHAMNPEAREKLDKICEQFKKEMKKDISEINGYQALYWLLRWSSLFPFTSIFKIEETKEYGNIFETLLPIKFFFNKDGSFDGIEIYVESCNKREHKLIQELLEKFGRETGIKHRYVVEEDERDNLSEKKD